MRQETEIWLCEPAPFLYFENGKIAATDGSSVWLVMVTCEAMTATAAPAEKSLRRLVRHADFYCDLVAAAIRRGDDIDGKVWVQESGVLAAKSAGGAAGPSTGADLTKREPFPRTPDGRYMVVRGRLWRLSNPNLNQNELQVLVSELMNARRAVKDANDDTEAKAAARSHVDAAKTALGGRGPVWWTDGALDYNRKLAKMTPYREWFEALTLIH